MTLDIGGVVVLAMAEEMSTFWILIAIASFGLAIAFQEEVEC